MGSLSVVGVIRNVVPFLSTPIRNDVPLVKQRGLEAGFGGGEMT
jgi:hypothetical protein